MPLCKTVNSIDSCGLADHTKIGKSHSFISGTPDQISCVITDKEADLHVLEKLQGLGIEIIRAEAERSGGMERGETAYDGS